MQVEAILYTESVLTYFQMFGSQVARKKHNYKEQQKTQDERNVCINKRKIQTQTNKKNFNSYL